MLRSSVKEFRDATEKEKIYRLRGSCFGRVAFAVGLLHSIWLAATLFAQTKVLTRQRR